MISSVFEKNMKAWKKSLAAQIEAQNMETEQRLNDRITVELEVIVYGS